MALPTVAQLSRPPADALVEKGRGRYSVRAEVAKILTQLENGMQAIIADGELAKKEKAKAERIEQMTAPQRRLLNIGPSF